MSDTLVRIVFGKTLARAALGGREEWSLYLSNPSVGEAIRAVDINVRGKLRQYLAGKGRDKHYKVALGRKDNLLDKEELRHPSGKQDIYILPVVRGRKSGPGRIIAGIILIIASFWFPPAAEGGFSLLASTTALTGASLVVGGITQLLTPTPGFNSRGEEDGRGSNIIDGDSSTVSQGAAVGLVYGRAMVSPMPISVSFTAYDQSPPNSFAPATATTTYGPGGIINQIISPPDPRANLPIITPP